ncbi:hypothetical protein Syun_001948 [Stephania yunnanensis]|uniref:Uncharacterized protein n=1 Tax=Stephania yunnanensis TaxID=152371 RepID=A0AAP0Q7L9_9MAGN
MRLLRQIHSRLLISPVPIPSKSFAISKIVGFALSHPMETSITPKPYSIECNTQISFHGIHLLAVVRLTHRSDLLFATVSVARILISAEPPRRPWSTAARPCTPNINPTRKAAPLQPLHCSVSPETAPPATATAATPTRSAMPPQPRLPAPPTSEPVRASPAAAAAPYVAADHGAHRHSSCYTRSARSGRAIPDPPSLARRSPLLLPPSHPRSAAITVEDHRSNVADPARLPAFARACPLLAAATGHRNTHDQELFSFHRDHSPCDGFEEVLNCYNVFGQLLRLTPGLGGRLGGYSGGSELGGGYGGFGGSGLGAYRGESSLGYSILATESLPFNNTVDNLREKMADIDNHVGEETGPIEVLRTVKRLLDKGYCFVAMLLLQQVKVLADLKDGTDTLYISRSYCFLYLVLERFKNLGVEQIEEIHLPEIMVPLVGTPQATGNKKG